MQVMLSSTKLKKIWTKNIKLRYLPQLFCVYRVKIVLLKSTNIRFQFGIYLIYGKTKKNNMTKYFEYKLKKSII